MVGYAGDVYNLAGIVNSIHDSVIAYANPPEVLVSEQLFAAEWSGIGGQAFNFRCYPRNETIAQTLQLFPRRRFDLKRVFSHADARA